MIEREEMEMDWISRINKFSDLIEKDFLNFAKNYKGLSDSRGNFTGMYFAFEEERRGIGKGHGGRTEIVEGTKRIIRDLIKTKNVVSAEEEFCYLLADRGKLVKIVQPAEQAIYRLREADQELVEVYYVIKYFGPIFLGNELTVSIAGLCPLETHPAIFANGLLDVITELTKMTEGELLMLPESDFSYEKVMDLRARCVGVAQGIWNFLDTFEPVYGGVIDLGRHFSEKFKSKLRQRGYAITGMRSRMLALREQYLMRGGA